MTLIAWGSQQVPQRFKTMYCPGLTCRGLVRAENGISVMPDGTLWTSWYCPTCYRFVGSEPLIREENNGAD